MHYCQLSVPLFKLRKRHFGGNICLALRNRELVPARGKSEAQYKSRKSINNFSHRTAGTIRSDNLRVERSAFHASATIAIVVIVCRRKIEGDHKDVIRLTKEYTHHVYNLRSRCMGQAIGKSERIILGLSRLKVRIPPPIPNVLARRSRVRRRAVPVESILHLFVVSALTLPSKKRHSPRYPSEHPQR